MAKVVMIGPFADSLRNFRGNLLREMVRHGHHVIACAPNVSEHIQKELLQIKVEYQDVPLERAGLNPYRDLQSILFLVRLLKEHSPDVVFLYCIKPVIYGSIAASMAKVPFIGSMITGLGNTFTSQDIKWKTINYLVRPLYRAALKNNKKIFFQNIDDLNLFKSLNLIKGGCDCIMVNGSGVDLEFFKPQPLPNETSFILVARLIKEKGVKEYFTAARLIKEKYPLIKFRIVGWIDNEQHSVSIHEIKELDKDNIVEFLGKLDDVRSAIANSSVCVLPSYREGTPRTMLEGMAMGRPLITTNAPGCRETVKEGVNGFLVPVGDARALAQAMENFILQPELIAPMGAASRDMATEKFDEKKVNRIILENLSLISKTHSKECRIQAECTNIQRYEVP